MADIVIPPNLPADVRQVFTAMQNRIKELESQMVTKSALASAGVVRIDTSGNMSAVVRTQDALNKQR